MRSVRILSNFIIIVLTMWAVCFAAVAQAEDSGIAQTFSQYSSNGTLIVERLSDGKRWIHDGTRAGKPFIPASTFKIPHTIIALETGVVRDVEEVIKWDGKVRRIKSWNKSQDLREAIKNSAVPIYQSVAKRIGLARMKAMLAKMKYGNSLAGETVDDFWLKGPLRISAYQQIDFLKRLYRRELPVSKRAQELTIEIIERDRTDTMIHRGKTGWEIASSPAIGWYVGWQEMPDDVLFFALNMDMTEKSHRHARVEIVRDALAELIGTQK